MGTTALTDGFSRRTGLDVDVSGLKELRGLPETMLIFSVSPTRPGSLSWTTLASTTGSSPSSSTSSRLETGLNSGWELSLESVTARTLQENGFGLTRTRLSSGSTGLMENPTTTTESTAWV